TKAPQGNRPCRPRALPIDPRYGDFLGGSTMKTAIARRLARRLSLGDRVLWVGNDDRRPGGPGTITRITAHQIEVWWEGETARRYRRAQLHNLRHVKSITAAADPRDEAITFSPIAWEFARYVRQRSTTRIMFEVAP